MYFQSARSTTSVILILGVLGSLFAVESGQFRLLSTSTSSKMILVSQIPSKTKYLLDASTAKITIDGKPGEFQALQAFTAVTVKYDLRKSSKDGIEIDGVATEIRVNPPPKPK